jgi:hypothetical protein
MAINIEETLNRLVFYLRSFGIYQQKCDSCYRDKRNCNRSVLDMNLRIHRRFDIEFKYEEALIAGQDG